MFISSDSVRKLLRFLIAGGIFPLKELLDSVRVSSESALTFDGSSPERLLLLASSMNKEGSVNHPCGIEPLSKLLPIRIFIRDLQSARSVGMWPEKELSIRISLFSFPLLHRFRGINPVNLFEATSSNSSFPFAPRFSGNWNVKLLLQTWNNS